MAISESRKLASNHVSVIAMISEKRVADVKSRNYLTFFLRLAAFLTRDKASPVEGYGNDYPERPEGVFRRCNAQPFGRLQNLSSDQHHRHREIVLT